MPKFNVRPTTILRAPLGRIVGLSALLQLLPWLCLHAAGEASSPGDASNHTEPPVAFAEAIALPSDTIPDWVPGTLRIEAGDGSWWLGVGGRVQPRGEFVHHSDQEATSSFFLRRVRVDLRGVLLDGRLTFRVMPELAGTPSLRDGWVNYAFSPMLQVRLGQFVVPFQWHRFVSGNRHHFAERGRPSRTFGFPNGYDSGIGLLGTTAERTFSYGIGVFDGAGRNVRDSHSSGLMASARATWALHGRIPVEEPDYAASNELQVTVASGLQGATRNEVRRWDLGRSAAGNVRADWVTGVGDLSLRWRGISVTSEGYIRRVQPADPALDDYTGWAHLTTAGWFVLPRRFELIGRFSQHELDRRDADTREREWGLGGNIYHRGHAWKTQVNYFNVTGHTHTEHIFLVQMHLQF